MSQYKVVTIEGEQYYLVPFPVTTHTYYKKGGNVTERILYALEPLAPQKEATDE